jgi:Zn-dependent protease/predicted transcriptional regulator
MSGSLRLGRVWGIDVKLHYSWFIIFALITASLSLSFLEEHPLWVRIMTGVSTSILLFASVLAHELAHSLVAIRNGIPVKSITLFFLGGVAHIRREAAHPRTELLVAIAGPLCSLVLAAIFGLVWFAVWGIHDADSVSGDPVFWLAWINLVLALFNLIPGFPLDGGRVLRAIIWRRTKDYKKASHSAALVGQGVAYLMIAFGVAIVLGGSRIYEGLTAFSGIWIAFIGWFLYRAATTSYRQVELREALRHFKVRSVMGSDYVAVSPDVSLRELVEGYVLRAGSHYFVVFDEGRMKGILTYDDIKSVPQERWGATPVSAVMVPADKLIVAEPEEGALQALERMDDHDADAMPVVKDGIVLGMIVRQNLFRIMQLRSELGS